MRVLGIESSCDETSAAVVRLDGGRPTLESVVILSQDVHKVFGGVVPELASRAHLTAVGPVVDRALAEAGTSLDGIDAIAVTAGPGLVGALLVGVMYGKTLAWATGRPLIGVHHMEGHLFAPSLEDPEFAPPFAALLVSGGHTLLLDVPAWGEYRLLGQTLDDAAGEAYDKVAKRLGLGFPGGPVIDRLAAQGNPAAFDFPRPMLDRPGCDFSFSGLKTAVATVLQKHAGPPYPPELVADVAASFQAAVVETLVAKCRRAVRETGARALNLGGGVACNKALRAALAAAFEPLGVPVRIPSPRLCADNAGMIAWVGAQRLARGERSGPELDAVASLEASGLPLG